MKTTKIYSWILAFTLIFSVFTFGMLTVSAADQPVTQGQLKNDCGITVDGSAGDWVDAKNHAASSDDKLFVNADSDYVYFFVDIPYSNKGENLWKVYLCVNFQPDASKGKLEENLTVNPYVEARIAADGTKADVWPMTSSVNHEDGAGLGYVADNIKTTVDTVEDRWTMEIKLPIPDAVKTAMANQDEYHIKFGLFARYNSDKMGGNQDLHVTKSFDWNNGTTDVDLFHLGIDESLLPIAVDGKADEAAWEDATVIDEKDIKVSFLNDGKYLYVFTELSSTDFVSVSLPISFGKYSMISGSDPAKADQYVSKTDGTTAGLFRQFTMKADGTHEGFDATGAFAYSAERNAVVNDTQKNVWTWEFKLELPETVKNALLEGNSKISVDAQVQRSSGSSTWGYDGDKTTKEITLVGSDAPDVPATPIKFTVTWSVRGTNSTEEYEKGATPQYKGSLDSFEANGYRYTFKGWSPELKKVTYDVTYTAEWSREKLETPTTEPSGSLTDVPTADPSESPEVPGGSEQSTADVGTEEEKGCKSAVSASALVMLVMGIGSGLCLKSSKKH